MEGFLRQGLAVMDATPGRGARLVSKFPTRTHMVTRSYLSMFLAELGRFAEARALADEALAMAEDSTLPYSLIMALWQGGAAFSSQGDFQGPTRGSSVRSCSRRRGVTRARRVCAGASSDMLARSPGRRAKASSSCGRPCNRSMPRPASPGCVRDGCRSSGEANLLAGEVGAASDFAAEALALSRQRRERGFEAWALRLVGEIALHRDMAGVPSGAEAYVGAIALADELGLRPLQAHCHLGLAKLYQRTGDRQRAQEHLTTATTMYREMDMRFWLEQAEALGSPEGSSP